MSFDFVPVTQDVTFPGGRMAVRGLSLQDIMLLVADHRSVLSGMFDQAAADPENALSVASLMGARLVQEAPQLATDVISLAADVPTDLRANVAKIPFPAQIEALEAIARLTFQTENDLKKVLETVLRTAKGVTDALTTLQT